MRIVAFAHAERRCVGALVDGGVVDLAEALGGAHGGDPLATLIDRFEACRARIDAACASDDPIALEHVTLLAPIAARGKVLCVLDNRPDGRTDGPPFAYLKHTSVGVGTDAILRLPADAGVRYEAELAAVVRGPARDVAPGDWRRAVFGFTAFVDVVRAPSAFPAGAPVAENWMKSWDTAWSSGPCLVPADAVSEPGRGLELGVDGRCTVRDPSAPDIGAIVAFLTSVMTLRSGDLIALGAHEATVTAAQPGDRVTVSVPEIGSLVSRVAA